jgi:hypothetical protein
LVEDRARVGSRFVDTAGTLNANFLSALCWTSACPPAVTSELRRVAPRKSAPWLRLVKRQLDCTVLDMMSWAGEVDIRLACEAPRASL